MPMQIAHAHMSRDDQLCHILRLGHLGVSGSVDGLNASQESVVDFGFSVNANSQNLFLESFAGVGESQRVFGRDGWTSLGRGKKEVSFVRKRFIQLLFGQRPQRADVL